MAGADRYLSQGVGQVRRARFLRRHHADQSAARGEGYNPDCAAMVRACGGEGVGVDRAGDLGEAIRKGIAANKPYLIDVDIAADINPAGAGVWELPGLGRSKPGIGMQYEPT